MFSDWTYATLQDRMARERELAEQRRQARAAARKPSLRARVARRLFALAVALDGRETWSAVWERLEAKGRL
jgi:anti-sigma-K factor RskA